MLRRPPRSTLFPYTTPLPISTEENYASLNLVHSCWTDRGGDCEIGHACAHDYFLDHRARHHRIDHRRRSHSHVFTTGQCAIPSGWSHFFHPGSDSGSLHLLQTEDPFPPCLMSS